MQLQYFNYPSLLNKVLKSDLLRCQTFKNLKKIICWWLVRGWWPSCIVPLASIVTNHTETYPASWIGKCIFLLITFFFLQNQCVDKVYIFLTRLELGLVTVKLMNQKWRSIVNILRRLKSLVSMEIKGSPILWKLYLPMPNLCRKLLSSHTSLGLNIRFFIMFFVSLLFLYKYLFYAFGLVTNTNYNLLQLGHADVEDFCLLTELNTLMVGKP